MTLCTTRIVRRALRPANLSLRPPGSKSVTNRALIAAALSGHSSLIANASDSTDTAALVEALRMLGFVVVVQDGNAALGPRQRATTTAMPAPSATGSRTDRHRTENIRTVVHAGAGGTTARFLLPLLAALPGEYVLDGEAQLRARPFGPLVRALRKLGAGIDGPNDAAPLPLIVHGGTLHGGSIEIDSTVSSQFVSALMLAAPVLREGLEIVLHGDPVSQSYINMTAAVLRCFGVQTIERGESMIRVPYAPGFGCERFEVPPDASGAVMLWAAAAATGSRILVPGLCRDGSQGDLAALDLFARMGCAIIEDGGGLGIDGASAREHGLRPLEANFRDMPDSVPALCALAALAKGTSRFEGISHLRFKESDRVAALTAGLAKLGVATRMGGASADWLEIDGGGPMHPATISTYDDHRIAMAFAVLGLAIGGLAIENPACVAKSYPEFWEHVSRIESSDR